MMMINSNDTQPLVKLKTGNYRFRCCRRRLNSSPFSHLILVTILTALVTGTFGKLQFCEVETGQTNIILDIEESRGSCK